MNSQNTVFIQLNSQSIVQLVNAINLLEQNAISYTIIENDSHINNKNGNDRGIERKLGSKGLKILDLLSEGYTYNEIANKAEVSIDGVRYYIKKIFRALDVNNGREAVRVYLRDRQAILRE